MGAAVARRKVGRAEPRAQAEVERRAAMIAAGERVGESRQRKVS